MSDLKLHMVSFAIPDPPDYGGIIDVYYKIKCLAEAGVEIYLHCSQYDNRQPSSVIENWCKKVWYYPRKSGLQGLSLSWPYITYSRRDDQLLSNLQQVEAPIFFDGLSTAFYANHPSLSSRVKLLRPQNVEQDYYALLAKRTPDLLKKLYYTIEARLLAKQEAQLSMMNAFFTVAQHDYHFFNEKYPQAYHQYLPSFQPYNEVSSSLGSGSYCLYHGNLSVAENEEAALYLIQEVFPKEAFPLMIAGKNPSKKLQEAAHSLSNCSLIANPDKATMEQLIADAHIHVLPTFQDTGLKLKLLHALFHGRHLVVNSSMLTGTGLASICHIADTALAFQNTIQALIDKPFDDATRAERRVLLSQHYNNQVNANLLLEYLKQLKH